MSEGPSPAPGASTGLARGAPGDPQAAGAAGGLRRGALRVAAGLALLGAMFAFAGPGRLLEAARGADPRWLCLLYTSPSPRDS